MNECIECKAPTSFDAEMQDYVCSHQGCQCYQEVGNDMAFDDCRKCGGQCRVVRELSEVFRGARYDGEPEYGEGEEVTLVCNLCQNERAVSGEDAEYFLNLHV